jgi:hypothetical protein
LYFLFDLDSLRLVHYISTSLEENILSGQLDLLGSAAGNAAVILLPKYGGWREKNDYVEKFTTFADNPFDTGCRAADRPSHDRLGERTGFPSPPRGIG